GWSASRRTGDPFAQSANQPRGRTPNCFNSTLARLLKIIFPIPCAELVANETRSRPHAIPGNVGQHLISKFQSTANPCKWTIPIKIRSHKEFTRPFCCTFRWLRLRVKHLSDHCSTTSVTTSLGRRFSKSVVQRCQTYAGACPDSRAGSVM